jgi:hypothetical protein
MTKMDRLQIKEYKTVEIELFSEGGGQAVWDRWLGAIAKMILRLSGSGPITLLTINPDKKRSIGYDVGKVVKEGKANDRDYRDYLVTLLERATEEGITEILGEDDFWLGRMAIAPFELSDEDALVLAIVFDRDVVVAGLEVFFMSGDGWFLRWNNPSANRDVAQELLLMERDFAGEKG